MLGKVTGACLRRGWLKKGMAETGMAETGMAETSMAQTRIAIVGTGFVSDYYMTTLKNHPNLQLMSVWDQNPDRLAQFCAFYSTKPYANLDALLADETVDIVVNLTTPDSHFAINMASLKAGKHVYCEKPLALTYEDAQQVIDYAQQAGLNVCSAPANGLSAAFNACEALLKRGDIGAPKLAYVEMEDGPVFRNNWTEWKSVSGAPWPGRHEFEIGCTLEHAGYGMSWLIKLFGPVKRVQTFSHLAFPDKGADTAQLDLGADFSVGCLEFSNGLVARLTCGLAAPRDRSLTILGDKGHLIAQDLWDHQSKIYLSKPGAERSLANKIADKLEHLLGRGLPFNLVHGRHVAYKGTKGTKGALELPKYPSQIDFAGGIAEQARALSCGQTPFFSGQVALHATEIVLALSAGIGDGVMKSSFEA